MDKQALRRRLLAAREVLDPAARDAAGAAICGVVLPSLAGLRSVGCYVAIGTEPPTHGLLTELRGRGVEVLLPVLRPDNDLDWAPYDGRFVTGRYGLREPAAARRGAAAISSVDAVVVPALAVDRTGRRLGRGGGSYDRVLARLHPGTWTVALLYEGEVLDEVPAQPHDRSVKAAATPSGIHRF